MDSTALCLLLAIVQPMWLAAGFGDYPCHRATRIGAGSVGRRAAPQAMTRRRRCCQRPSSSFGSDVVTAGQNVHSASTANSGTR